MESIPPEAIGRAIAFAVDQPADVDAEHALGGVTAYDESPHTTPADLEHVARVQRVSTAYLRRALGRGEEAVATVAGLETEVVR